METGKVQWFNAEKGYGFIRPESGQREIFVHISAVESAGYKTLKGNQAISFEIQTKNGKPSAINLQVI